MENLVKKLLLGVGLIGTLAGCVTAASFYPQEISRSQIDRVKNHLVADMRDPSSAAFRNIRSFAMHDRGDIIVCGELNGKNAYGGFTGFQPFRASIDPRGNIHYYSAASADSISVMASTSPPCR